MEAVNKGFEPEQQEYVSLLVLVRVKIVHAHIVVLSPAHLLLHLLVVVGIPSQLADELLEVPLESAFTAELADFDLLIQLQIWIHFLNDFNHQRRLVFE